MEKTVASTADIVSASQLEPSFADLIHPLKALKGFHIADMY